MAFKAPARRPLTLTVKLVGVAAVTVPVPVGVKATVLFAAVASKPVPVMTRVEDEAGMAVVLSVTVGAALEEPNRKSEVMYVGVLPRIVVGRTREAPVP